MPPSKSRQLKLFDLEHKHAFELYRGPIKAEPVIALDNGRKWCWTCGSWVDDDSAE